MHKNIATLTLFSLTFTSVTLPTPSAQPDAITIPAPTKRPATKTSRTVTQTKSFQEIAALHRKGQKLDRQPQTVQQHKASPVAAPNNIKTLKNPVKPTAPEKYDFEKEFAAYKNRPRNPMPNPNKTPFKV